MADVPEEAGSRPRAPSGLGAALLLALLVFLVTLAFLSVPGQPMVTGDSVPYRYLPEAIAERGTLCLDEWRHLAGEGHYAVVEDQEGHLVSKKPVLPALAILPVYMVWSSTGDWGEEARLRAGWVAMAVAASLTAALLALALLPLVGWWLAGLAGAGLVLATPFWFTAMDAWPHPLTALANVVSLYIFLAGSGNRRWLGIGAAQGFAFACRFGSLPVLLLFLAFAVLHRWQGRREAVARAGLLLLGAAPFMVFLGVYHQIHFGSPFVSGFGGQAADRIRWPLEGIAGLLLSPAKGLVLFSPVLLAAALMPWGKWREPAWMLCGLAVLVHLFFWACYADWWGGWAWGPRYMADVMPFAAALAAGGLRERLFAMPGRRTRVYTVAAAAALLAASVTIQATGLLTWDGAYHEAFDEGWGAGHHWVWTAPWEPAWRWSEHS